jgi:hypothetical protein
VAATAWARPPQCLWSAHSDVGCCYVANVGWVELSIIDCISAELTTAAGSGLEDGASIFKTGFARAYRGLPEGEHAFCQRPVRRYSGKKSTVWVSFCGTECAEGFSGGVAPATNPICLRVENIQQQRGGSIQDAGSPAYQGKTTCHNGGFYQDVQNLNKSLTSVSSCILSGLYWGRWMAKISFRAITYCYRSCFLTAMDCALRFCGRFVLSSSVFSHIEGYS